ncbi:MAG TPA: S-layer homology domain-containing protein [Pseudobacteroides sp.]|uniref:S-layer homology domain-containing protein n=1 Tax=Pseudobacteroides sp. TaxID=1968840 RepID=UPI002F95963E
MFKIITKRVLSCVVILCLSLSSLGITAYSNSEQSATEPELSAKVSGVQKFIIAALAVTEDKRLQAADCITKIDEFTSSQAKDKIYELLNINLNQDDLTMLMTTFKGMSPLKREFIADMVIHGYSVSSNDFSKFRNVANKINYIVTGDINNDNGTKFIVTVLETLAVHSNFGVPTVFDLDGDTKKIKFELNTTEVKKTFINNLLKDLLVYVEDLPTGVNNNSSIDVFLLRAQNSLNRLEVGSEIEEFKKHLENKENKNIYDGKLNFVPIPTSVPSNPPPSPSYTTQPTATIPGGLETPTPTPTSTPTVTPTSVPTAAPTLAPSEKKITAFSFKGIANSKGVIFEKIHTIYVKVPTGTDLKKVEPEIQFRGASIKPEAGVKKNFNNPVFYTVTALDKSKVKYVVIVGTENVVVEPPEVKPGYGPFGDIFNHWAEERMISMIENGAIAGYPDGTVKPDLDMTRAEVITTLVKAIGLEPAKDPKLKFADIKSIPTWAQGYIQVALEKGIVAGYPDNTYKANNKVTREEFLVMAMKAFNYEASKNTALKFKDAKAVSGWALGYVAKAIELTIIEGYKEDNTIKPNKKITRAEVMTIIDKCITLSAKK